LSLSLVYSVVILHCRRAEILQFPSIGSRVYSLIIIARKLAQIPGLVPRFSF
jgi:hypothetical protein